MARFPRRHFLAAGGAFLAMPLAAVAQQPGKVHRIALLSIGTDPKRPERWQPLLDALRELGYVEGQNLLVTRHFGDGKADRLPGLAANLARERVDVIVTTGDREIVALRPVVGKTPVVMTFVTDPVGKGFVSSLARPGGNITGISSLVPGQIRKYVELLRETVPSASRFAVVASMSNTSPFFRRDYEAAAQALGMTVLVANVSDPATYDAVLGRARKDGATAIIAPMDGETARFRQELAQAALKHRLPGVYGDRVYLEAGGLVSFSSNWGDRLRRAAILTDKILRGASPADLPVELPTKFELVVNLKAARALGLEVPQSLLLRADEVIE